MIQLGHTYRWELEGDPEQDWKNDVIDNLQLILDSPKDQRDLNNLDQHDLEAVVKLLDEVI